MGSTYTLLNYHIVFSTKDRVKFITDWSNDLHAYLGGAIRGMGGKAMCIGGIEDHVHVLASLKATHCLADVVRDMKKQSSIWARENHSANFGWQDGYAAFTVGPRGIENVRKYISNQEEHHKNVSFIEELKKMLDEAGVLYDERYLL